MPESNPLGYRGALRYAVRHAPHPSPENGIARINIDSWRIEENARANIHVHRRCIDHRCVSRKRRSPARGPQGNQDEERTRELVPALFDLGTKIEWCSIARNSKPWSRSLRLINLRGDRIVFTEQPSSESSTRFLSASPWRLPVGQRLRSKCGRTTKLSVRMISRRSWLRQSVNLHQTHPGEIALAGDNRGIGARRERLEDRGFKSFVGCRPVASISLCCVSFQLSLLWTRAPFPSCNSSVGSPALQSRQTR